MTDHWIAHLLSTLRRLEKKGSIRRFNPNPPNQFKENSITHDLFLIFTAHPSRFFAKHQLIELVEPSRPDIKSLYKAVDWGLIFLRSQGVVEAVIDSRRNSRYNRYRLSPVWLAKNNPYADNEVETRGGEQ